MRNTSAASIQHLMPTHVCPTCGRGLHAWVGLNSHLWTPCTWSSSNWCHGHLLLRRTNNIKCLLVNKLSNYTKSLSMTLISFDTSIFQFQIVLLWWLFLRTLKVSFLLLFKILWQFVGMLNIRFQGQSVWNSINECKIYIMHSSTIGQRMKSENLWLCSLWVSKRLKNE